MPCAEADRLQAYFDDELDATAARQMERHLERCQECSELLASLADTRAMLRHEMPPSQAPQELRDRIQRALDREESLATLRQSTGPRRWWRLAPFWWGSLSGAGATLATGLLAFLVWTVPAASPLVDGVLQAHLGSLSSAHLIDVVSTDRHTVKPWFSGRADVSPAVEDFAASGYRLLGGRVDTLEHQRAAVTVYQHGAHVISVFCWIAPQGPLPRETTRQGYRLVFWRSGDLAYAAISDTAWDELTRLELQLQSLERRDAAPGNTPAGRE